MSKILKPRRGKYSTMTGSKSATVLAAGEMFLEVPSNGINSGNGDCRIKVGNGTSAYSDLSYAVGGPNMTFRDNEIIQESGVNISSTTTSANTEVKTTIAVITADLNYISSGHTIGQIIGTIKTILTRLNQVVTNINTNSSHVGMIIQSTKLSTLSQVQAVYGSNTIWVQHTGYILRGASSNVSFNSTSKDGGEDTHTLSVDEMPEHNHSLYVYNDDFSNGGDSQTDASKKKTSPGFTYDVALGQNKWAYNQITTAGSGVAHNNMQSYKNVYIWERIS